ncbi:MAG: ribose 5-phosphate isomerase B [Bacteroidota bacterium]
MPGRPLITERDVRRALADGQRSLALPPNALVTALARDTAHDHGLTLAEPGAASEVRARQTTTRPAPPKTLAVGCDHAGFAHKAALAQHAEALGWTVRDVGTDSDASVDYPDFAFAVARLVALGEVQCGLVIDGVGVGSAMVANKVAGVRAACCASEFAAFNARAHNDAHVLTLGSRTSGIEVSKRVLATFLTTAFEGGRHAGRVQKIEDVETRFLRAGERENG